MNLDCLVPCDAAEADGSPTNFIVRIEFVRDIKIDELIHTNGQFYGVTFSWGQASTVQLEGTFNLTNWTRIARFFGDPPRTTWTTNVSLNSYGQFFRLSLVANQHLTNAVAASRVASSMPELRDVPISTKEFIQNRIRIGFASSPDAVYEVEICDWSGKIIATRQVVATGVFTTVTFECGETTGSGFFKVRQMIKS